MASSSAHYDSLVERSQKQQQHEPSHQHYQVPSSAMMQPSHHPSSSSHHPKLICANESGEGGAASGLGERGELDEALFLYLNSNSQQQNHQKLQERHSIADLQQQITRDGGMRPPTLNIFPSIPMHVNLSSVTNQVNKSTENDPTGLVVVSEAAKEGEASGGSSSKMLSPEPISVDILPNSALIPNNNSSTQICKQGGRIANSITTRPQTRDAKTLRRLAQNREAARKSRLRKKAYVQQLESSRIRLAQLEQELQRARSQGMCFGGGLVLAADQHQGLPGAFNNFPTDAAIFDMEYGRWLEEHHRRMCQLRAAVEEHLAENELQVYVENCITHFDEILNIKSAVARTDVFHLISGSWKSPAERCFMWIGGFRPSQIIKIVVDAVEGLGEQQAAEMCVLQRSTEEAEEALSQGLEVLNQSLSETIAYDSLASPPHDMANYMGQMAIAASKLSALEGFVRQADNLRHQTVHRLHQVLMTRQAARGLLLVAEYFNRLRALSSLWLARPTRE